MTTTGAAMATGGAGRARRAVAGVTVGMQCKVRPATRQRASEVADALGITMGRYVEWLVWRDALDAEGRPRWSTETDMSGEPVPSDQEDVAA